MTGHTQLLESPTKVEVDFSRVFARLAVLRQTCEALSNHVVSIVRLSLSRAQNVGHSGDQVQERVCRVKLQQADVVDCSCSL